MPKKGKLGEEDVEFIVKEDLDNLNKRIDEISGLLKQRLSTDSTHEEQDQYCPQCQARTKDLYLHLKNDPEKHGLVKTVEVTRQVEVPKKRSMKEILSEHDIFECEDCRKEIDEHLEKKGLKISKAEEKEEKEWDLEI